MSSTFVNVMILFSALGSALVAGIFFAFSTFVMKALGRLQPEQGIAAMQAINVTVLNPWFFTVFFDAIRHMGITRKSTDRLLA